MDALKSIQLKFYEDFPAVVPQEADYGFSIPSTMKPTQWSCKFEIHHSRRQYMYITSLILITFLIVLDPEGAINQIPEKCTIAGDVRYICTQTQI